MDRILRHILYVTVLIMLFVSVTTQPVLAVKPDNCDDTAYQAHPGYAQNRETWDRYTAETDGVCQTRYGTGIPSSPCVHTVQVSVAGQPYYLCWYNVVDDVIIAPITAPPQVYNYLGREYYVVSSEDPTGDTGNEVCAKVGKICIGYTDETDSVCRFFHTDARISSSMDGDRAGVYCDGPPQTGVCANKYRYCHTCPDCTNTVDCATPIGNLYHEMFVECGDVPEPKPSFFSGFFSTITGFFTQLFARLAALFRGGGFTPQPGQPGITILQNRTIIETIGPYPDKWACEFFQIPWPGVNKKHVSCPYETPGAAINDAANGFCRTVMGSMHAEAAVCNENGLIVCIHPCPPNPPHIIPDRCAFDNDRPRGNQAPPLNWCPPLPTTTIKSWAGKPDNCDDTAYQAHPGYNENQALWDSYMADTDGVCQTRYGTGIPSSPCAHTVQVSVGGQPYYLCWYNN